MDEGESFCEAGIREAREEAGVRIEITGVLRMMLSHHTPRVVLMAKALGGDSTTLRVPPKL